LTIPEDLEELVKDGKAEHVVIDETNGAQKYISDWAVDIKMLPVYTERRRVSEKLPTVRYGDDLKAILVYLQNIGMMSLVRVAEFIKVATNGLITVSQGAIVGFSRAVAEKIDLEPYINDLLNGETLYVDETPAKTTERQENGKEETETVSHTTMSAYIRTYSNSTTTVLTANAHKDDESVKLDDILPRYCGIVSQDHEAKFYNYGSSHATCGAHLCRELLGLEDLYKLSWAGVARKLFLKMNSHKNEGTDKKETCCDPALLLEFEKEYDEIVAQGLEQHTTMKPKTFGYDELRRMVNRLRDYKDSYLLFIRNYAAPFTNNQAERDLRHCKTKQKVSGCFRKWQGLLDYCKIRSLTDTVKKRGQNSLVALRSHFALAAE
jgi:transposase